MMYNYVFSNWGLTIKTAKNLLGTAISGLRRFWLEGGARVNPLKE